MRNIYFDLCAIPVFLLILFAGYSRRLIKNKSSRLFMLITLVSLVCTAADVLMELTVNPVPLSREAMILGNAISYLYFLLRNSSLVLYFMFLMFITRTDYQLRPLTAKIALWLPYAAAVALLARNLFAHNVFTVTQESGYARGAVMAGLYLVSAYYGVIGTVYCVYSRRYLTVEKWVSLLSVYVLTFIAVIIQLIFPELLVEMFSTALGLLVIMIMVMRPEETMDITVGILSWKAYQNDLHNLINSRQQFSLLVMQLSNAQEIRAYLGDDAYNNYIAQIADEIRSLSRQRHIQQEMYFEHPGTLYLILEDNGEALPELVPQFLEETKNRTRNYVEVGVRFEPKLCLIRCPEDLKDIKDIINLGHGFTKLGTVDQDLFQASEIVKNDNFEIENHMDEILNRAITEHRIVMYYQPIYDVKTGRFHSAEALARLNDSKYGIIPPAIFIKEAEHLGLILPIGDEVLERVFRFIGTHDMEALGLSYIEINLSLAQCMQKSLPDTIARLQEKYRVNPSWVNLEITETTFEKVNDVARRNIKKLADMGYSFSLDDYGIGYSNIQRLSKLPLQIIKIDKSMVDELFTSHGRVIMQNTVRMMQGIDKELVIEGVETKEAIDVLKGMSCDFIQGFYYSKPLPEQDFIRFLKEQNGGEEQCG